MNKVNKLRYIILAVGVIASAAFYVRESSGAKLFTYDHDIAPGDSTYEGVGEAEAETLSEKQIEEIEEIVREAVDKALDARVSAAVREEILAAGEEGYLEAAVDEAKKIAESEAEAKKDMININTATAEELATLNGIGEAKAADIIAYREEAGGFKSIEELKNVSGIADKSFDKIKDKIYV